MIGREGNNFLSLFDDSDGYDAPPGSHVTLNNVIPNKNWSSISGRGAFVEHLPLPTVGNGLVSGMSIYKVLNFKQFRVTSPSDKVISVLLAVCTFTPSGGSPVYMLRYFQSPSYSGSFGSTTSWQDKTPYFIDIVELSTAVARSAANSFTFTITAPANGGYFKGDLAGGYIFLEDSGSFTSPYTHQAEGDKVVSNAFNDFNAGTNLISLYTESDHSTMWANTQDVVRFHKNLTTGRIPYQELCSTDAGFFDQYTFAIERFEEGILISIHTGDSGRPSYTLYLRYVNNVFFGTGDVYSRADNIKDGIDRLFDKHLIYGLPAYDVLIKNGVNSFDGKTVSRWTAGTSPSAAASGSAAVTAGTFNKISGSFDLGSGFVAGDLTNNFYKIPDLDLSITVDDFVVAEFDTHGRWGTWRSFSSAWNGALSYWRHNHGNLRLTNGFANLNFYNFKEYTANADRDGMAVVSGETALATGSYFASVGGVHNKFRIGYQDEQNIEIPTASQAAGINVCIPTHFSRFLTDVVLWFATDDDNSSDILLSEKVIAVDSLQEGWELHLCMVDSNGLITNDTDEFFFRKMIRVDQGRHNNSLLGGNHLTFCGYPDYSKATIDGQNRDEVSLSLPSVNGDSLKGGYPIVKDFSFGAKFIAFAKDILFLANVQFQEYQNNNLSELSIVGTVFDSDSVVRKNIFDLFYSGIGAFGGNMHHFDSALHKWSCREIGERTGLAVASIPQGLEGATKEDENYVVIFGENGYKLLFLYPQTDPNARFDQNWSDVTSYSDTCIAPKSIVSEAGYVFFAGNHGVYLLEGSNKVDLTMGFVQAGTMDFVQARINKTWQSYTRDQKKAAIGMYFREKKWYILIVPAVDTFYIFDIDKKQIFTWTYAPLATEPTTSASNFAQTGATESSVNGSFTGGSGASGHLVVRFTGVSPASPVDGIVYSPGDALSGDTTVVGNVVTTFTDTSLSGDSTNKYAVFPFNGNSGSRNYKTSSPLTGNLYTLPDEPSAQPANFNVVDVGVFGGDDFNTFSTFDNVGDADGFILTRRPDGQPEIVPVDGNSYSDEQTVSGQTKCVHAGPWADFSSGYLQDGASLLNVKYIYQLYSYKENNGIINYRTSGSPSKNVDFSQPDTQPTGLILTKVGSDVKIEFTPAADVSFYIVIHNDTSSFNDPADGTTYSDDQVYGSFTVRVVHAGPYSDFAAGYMDNGPFGGGALDYYRVYAYNKKSSPNYLTTSPLSGSIAL